MQSRELWQKISYGNSLESISGNGMRNRGYGKQVIRCLHTLEMYKGEIGEVVEAWG